MYRRTRVDLSIVGHSIGIHDGLVASGELVGLEVGGRGIHGAHPVEDGGDGGPAALLQNRGREMPPLLAHRTRRL